MINRSALIVRAKQPFLDWLKSLPDDTNDDLTLDQLNDEPQVCLLADLGETNDSGGPMIRAFSSIVFELELEGWWTEESDWPQDRSYEVFCQWFDVSLHSMVHDLVDEPIIDDEDDATGGGHHQVLN